MIHLKIGDDEQAEKLYERFRIESRNAECPGCGQTALEDYVPLDLARGLVHCPRCKQSVDIRTMMKSWLGLNMSDAGEA